MFENLQERFERAFKVLKGHGSITEVNVGDTLKEVRKALLDADVDFKTAKNFIKTVKEEALGREVLTAIQPGQLLIKITHEELTKLMGQAAAPLELKGNPATVLSTMPSLDELAAIAPPGLEVRGPTALGAARGAASDAAALEQFYVAALVRP